MDLLCLLQYPGHGKGHYPRGVGARFLCPLAISCPDMIQKGTGYICDYPTQVFIPDRA